MKISTNTVLRITQLSRLKINSGELRKYQKEIEKILDYFSILERVDTDNIEPIAQITNLQNVYREDQIEESDLAEKLISNAPQSRGNLIKVKKVFE